MFQFIYLLTLIDAYRFGFSLKKGIINLPLTNSGLLLLQALCWFLNYVALKATLLHRKYSSRGSENWFAVYSDLCISNQQKLHLLGIYKKNKNNTYYLKDGILFAMF